MGDDFVRAFDHLDLGSNGRRRRRRRPRPQMYILRGLPGSGKSTLARQIKNTHGNASIFSTDDFFRDRNGEYKFKAYLLKTAHKWNQKRAREALENGESPVIIDNTNIHLWEMKPYVEMALEFGYYVNFKEPETSWKNNVYKLQRQLKGENGKVLSSDDYFKRNGKFDYNEQDQDKAHRENERKAWKAMKRGISPVIIDNTNVRLWYMKSYVEMADELHYTIEIVEQKDNKKCSIEELYRRTKGTIPMDKLQTMRDTFEEYETVDDIRNAKEPWRDHIPKLFLMRGVPGSGRAALAGKIKKDIGGVIINTRTYFTGRDGVYRFRPDLLPKAHEWIIRRAKKAMKVGISPVIIDTTNVLLWHMKPYVQMALQYYYKVIFKEPEGNSEQDASELYRRSGCRVPERVIGNMVEKFKMVRSQWQVLNSEEPWKCQD
nr:PREDICTED: NEDD4-binding protein 2-like 1 [Lepisosteus oculatus]